jgi:peroxiredoxin Q/BCP
MFRARPEGERSRRRINMTMPAVGEKAPSFNALDADGKKVKLSDFKGKKVVLYFYPRDLTPGCTKEACGFRDDLPKFDSKDVAILGVSSDDEASHRRFRETHDLNFTLLSDPQHELAETYGVWQEKNMYGRKSWGIKRTTFIIDEKGRIAHVFGKVDTANHSKDVLKVLDKL